MFSTQSLRCAVCLVSSYLCGERGLRQRGGGEAGGSRRRRVPGLPRADRRSLGTSTAFTASSGPPRPCRARPPPEIAGSPPRCPRRPHPPQKRRRRSRPASISSCPCLVALTRKGGPSSGAAAMRGRGHTWGRRPGRARPGGARSGMERLLGTEVKVEVCVSIADTGHTKSEEQPGLAEDVSVEAAATTGANKTNEDDTKTPYLALDAEVIIFKKDDKLKLNKGTPSGITTRFGETRIDLSH